MRFFNSDKQAIGRIGVTPKFEAKCGEKLRRTIAFYV